MVSSREIFQPSIRRPQLSLPYTVLTQKNRVRLVAGEDFRYTFEGISLEDWLPNLLQRLDGSRSLEELLQSLPETQRSPALKLMQQLYGERVLVDAPVTQSHTPQTLSFEVLGQGTLIPLLNTSTSVFTEKSSSEKLIFFCQDNLDYQTALELNRQWSKKKIRWFWISYGAMTRAYLSPLFLPEAGPCLECLIRQFKQISPFPEIYEELMQQPPVSIRSVESHVSENALHLLKSLALWKASLLKETEASAFLYRLHVIEFTSMEISTHLVRQDPECPVCAQYKR